MFIILFKVRSFGEHTFWNHGHTIRYVQPTGFLSLDPGFCLLIFVRLSSLGFILAESHQRLFGLYYILGDGVWIALTIYGSYVDFFLFIWVPWLYCQVVYIPLLIDV